MSISSISSLLDQSVSKAQQQLTTSAIDPITTTASNDTSSTPISGAVAKGGHHHHHRSFGSGQVDSKSVLDQLSQAFGPDAADDVTAEDGGVDLSKVSQLLGSKNQTQTSAFTATNPLLSITA